MMRNVQFFSHDICMDVNKKFWMQAQMSEIDRLSQLELNQAFVVGDQTILGFGAVRSLGRA